MFEKFTNAIVPEKAADKSEDRQLTWPKNAEFAALEKRSARKSLLEAAQRTTEGRANELVTELGRAVVSSDFSTARQILALIGEGVNNLENESASWTDLGPDAEDPIKAQNKYVADWRKGKI